MKTYQQYRRDAAKAGAKITAAGTVIATDVYLLYVYFSRYGQVQGAVEQTMCVFGIFLLVAVILLMRAIIKTERYYWKVARNYMMRTEHQRLLKHSPDSG